MKFSLFDIRLLALSGMILVAAGCMRDACNNECAPTEVCVESLLACVPADSLSDGGVVTCDSDADCTAALPHCDTGASRCVECLSNSHCASGQCEPFDFSCLPVGCLSAEDCDPTRPFCAADGACVECRTATDCPALGGERRKCNFATRKCAPDPCQSDADCTADPGGPACDGSSGLCVGCIDDSHCPEQRCHLAKNRCVGCLGDLDCDFSAGETCREETQACVVTHCVGDASCEGPGRCSADRECVACVDDDDCAWGGVCDGSHCAQPSVCLGDTDCLWPFVCISSACVACRDATDCRPGQVCNDGSCAEPADCIDSAACLAGRSCQNGACTDAACEPDAFEPNDTVDVATFIDPGTLDASLCHNDVDLYALEALEGHGVEAVVTWNPADGTPELELVAGLGGLVISTPSHERAPGRRVATLEKVGQGTKAVLVKVSANGGESSIPYTLATTVSATGLCEDDEREPDNTPAQASVTMPGTFEGILCPTKPDEPEVDWFAVDVPAEHEIGAVLTLGGSGAERATVEIHRKVDGEMRRESTGFESAESSSVAPPEGARYWVAVRNLTSRKLTYTLAIAVRARAPSNDTCPSDLSRLPVLPHNATVDGHTLGATNDQDSGCGGEAGDVFWHLLLEEDSSVNIRSTAAYGSVLSIGTGCAQSSELGCQAVETSANALKFDALPAGSYVVRFSGRADEQGMYTLSSEVAPAPSPPEGGTCQTATPLVFTSDVAVVAGNLARSSNEHAATCGIDGGDAYWSFALTESRRVRAKLEAFEGASVSLVSAAGCGVDSPVSCEAIAGVSAETWLERFALPPGEWVLVVDGGTARTGAFSLSVELSEALHPPPNDDCASVVGLNDGVTTADTRGTKNDFTPACGAATHSAGDAVWRLTLASGEEDVELQLAASFDGVVSVTDSPCGSGAVLACESGPQARVLLPALGVGEYYVWVDGYGSGEGPFTLTTTRRPATPLPTNDTCALAEPVDLAFDPGPVEREGSTLRAGNDLNPTACMRGPAGWPLELSGPDVSYRVTVPAGRVLLATLTPHDFDGALYILESCDRNTCLDASDESFVTGGTEHVSMRNDGPEPVDWIVVVDSFTTGARGRGAFTVRFELDE